MSDDDSDSSQLEAECEALEKQWPLASRTTEVFTTLLRNYKSLGELEKLRSTRQAFSERFCLSEQLWLEWLGDEIKLAQTSDQKAAVVKIFKRAVKDRFSVDLYCKMIEYAQDIEFAEIEELVIFAIENAGDDVAHSHKLWSQCLKLTPDKTTLLSKLENTALLHFDYNQWFPEPPATVKRIASGREQIEDKVLSRSKEAENEKDLAQVWYEYLQLELSNKRRKEFKKQRVLTVFERAVAACNTGGLWERYCEFLDYRVKDVSKSVEVHERAVRNCSWSSKLWCSYLRALERNDADIDQVLGRALQSSFTSPQGYYDVLMAACEQRRRAYTQSKCSEEGVMAMYNYAKTYLLQYHPAYLTAQLGVFVSMVRTEHLLFGRDVKDKWLSYLAEETSSQPYAKCLNFFYTIKDYDTYREVCVLAIAALRSDVTGLSSVCHSWLAMEKEFGTLETLDKAIHKTSGALREVNKRSHQQKRQQTQSHSRNTSKDERGAKRKRVVAQETPAKKKVKAEPATVVESETPKAVFVVNLKYGLSDLELKEFFSSCGEIESATVMTGRNRGRGKVEFKTTEAYENALKLSGSVLQGLPMQVIPFTKSKRALEAQKKERQQAHLRSKETNDGSTVLISNLSVDFCKSLCDTITSGSKSSGNPFAKELLSCGVAEKADIALNKTSLVVKFKSSEEAQRAIALSDNVELCKGAGSMKPRSIKVVLFVPGGQSGKKKGADGKGKKKKAKKTNEQPAPSSKGSGDIITTKAKSNDEFRRLLLRK